MKGKKADGEIQDWKDRRAEKSRGSREGRFEEATWRKRRGDGPVLRKQGG